MKIFLAQIRKKDKFFSVARRDTKNETNQEKNMTAQQYAEAVIQTALKNGMTLKEMVTIDPSELAEAHMHSQNKAIKKAGKEIFEGLR